jgi:antitoxin (DNA-binding transcriptional repressor) of toxin-antitoxin stability system
VRRYITQRELRNEITRLLRELENGCAFIVTRNGVAIGNLSPVRQRTFFGAAAVLAVFAGAPRIGHKWFRKTSTPRSIRT